MAAASARARSSRVTCFSAIVAPVGARGFVRAPTLSRGRRRGVSSSPMSRIIGEAIVVRVVDYGEADRVATLLLRAQGKVSALARGARRSRKRYGGLELFARGEATLREGRGELWGLEGFDISRGF